MIKIYTASGWFSENTNKSLTMLENKLKTKAYIEPYFPRHDGVKLSENEFHDHKLRKRIFLENVNQILSSDYLLVNLDGSDGYYDTGTCWELGYAMSHNIPTIIYDPVDKLHVYFEGLKSGFYAICTKEEEVDAVLDRIVRDYLESAKKPSKLLFVGPDTTEVQRSNNADIMASVILESHGDNFKWVEVSHPKLQENIEAIFKDVDYMVAVIDDRHPIVSWMMGQACERNIPIISFTNYDYGSNIMLACSILTHCKGKEDLKSTIQRIKREGLVVFGEYDTSGMRAY